MKKNLLMMIGIILAIGSMFASCEIDNSDTKSDEYREKLVNTYWQLTEVQDNSGRWQSVILNPELDIPELWFSSGKAYEMRIRDYDGYQGVGIVNGTYWIEEGTINMTNDYYHGIAFAINVRVLDDNLLEGSFHLWSGLTPIGTYYDGGNPSPQDKTYIIRMKRIR